MARYIVRETVTLMHFIEAETEAEAIEKMKSRSPRDFEEIDCSPRGANGQYQVELDPDYQD